MEDADPNVLMVSAECRDLAKVGGLADAVRDLLQALKSLGTPVSLVLPYYDRIEHPTEPVDTFKVPFGSRNDWHVKVFHLDLDGVPVYLLRSQEFFGGEYGDIYIDSDRLGRGIFEDDARRFAFFCTSVLEFILRYPGLAAINTLHGHDWHTGVMLVLLKYSARYRRLLNALHTLFTIHNLDYQGTRPFELTGERDFISFAQWFPELYHGLKADRNLADISDLHAPIPCFNPLRAGINLADNVNTVSPNYAREITQPDDAGRNFIGGRGLEEDLNRRGSQLSGILNGLDYASNNPSSLLPPYDSTLPNWQSGRRQHKINLLGGLPVDLEKMAVKLGRHFKNRAAVLKKMQAYEAGAWGEKPLVVAVIRAVRQKVAILLESLDGSSSVLQEILKRDIFLLVLGTGDLEDALEEINQHANGLFVCAFDPGFAGLLYAGGDIFLMPSDFEPCGITQMIAMRFACLPLVPDVGGLKDTVQDRVNGFVYHGVDRPSARQALLDTLDQAIACCTQDRKQWEAMQVQAMDARFKWSTSARKYIELYRKR
jgi:starch synthase